MDENLGNIQYASFRKYDYAAFFREKHYKEKVLNDEERKDTVAITDSTIANYLEGISLSKEVIDHFSGKSDDVSRIYTAIASTLLFVMMTTIDGLVLSKYFLLADKDYDKRVIRGKMQVLFNEGFKRLYGFEEKTRKNSEWTKLQPIVQKYFYENVKEDYRKISGLLEGQASLSSWWKEERNVETHLDFYRLYESREKELVESKVMEDFHKLFYVLDAVKCFLANMHTCLYNSMVEKYYKGELIEEN